jgi:hypothetical protein
MQSLQATALGGGAATAKTANYVLVAADAGTTVAMNAAGATTITVNTGLFAAGDTVFIQNLGAGSCVITAGTATVSTAGSLTLPQYDAGILYFTATGAAIFYDYIQAGGASPLTTKGDVYGFGTSDARIPIGANNTVLTADSTQSLGLKWAAPSGASFVGAKVTRSTTQSMANDTWTIISFDTEEFDTDNYYSSGAPTKFTIPSGKGGKYLITAVGYFNNASTSGSRLVKFTKNGNEYGPGYGTWMPAATTRTHALLNTVVALVATDYIEFNMYQNSGGSLNTDTDVPFIITYLGA